MVCNAYKYPVCVNISICMVLLHVFQTIMAQALQCGPLRLHLEFWSFKCLLRNVLCDQDTTIQWCMDNGLLARRQTCSGCNQPMLFVKREGTDSYRSVNVKHIAAINALRLHTDYAIIVNHPKLRVNDMISNP